MEKEEKELKNQLNDLVTSSQDAVAQAKAIQEDALKGVEKSTIGTTPKAEEAPETKEAKIKPQMSAGEKWYNRLVYQGLNYWVNLGISLVVTDLFLHGRGKDFYKNGLERFTKGISASTGMSKVAAKWTAGQAMNAFSLNSGGNILLIPTKFLEDNKRPIVHWLNDKLGVDQTAPDGHKETAKEIYIEQEQKPQSWGRMIWRRALGWGATTLTGMSIDKIALQKLPTPKMVDGELRTHKGGLEVFTDFSKGIANEGLRHVPGGNAVVNSPLAQRYMGYAAIDWIFTIITSKILHATNGAHKQEMPEEIGEPKDMPKMDAKKPEAKTEETTPEKSKVADIVRAKKQDETFVSALAGREAENTFQLGV